MSNVTKLLRNDHDKIRKSLSRSDLVYPADSADDRYVDAWNYVKQHNLSVEVMEGYDLSSIGLEDHELSQITQCRGGNSQDEKVEDYTSRFSNGEKLINPIIVIENDGSYYPVFGNQRGKALQQAGVTTTILVVGGDLPYDTKKTLATKLANISNRKTPLDVATDDREDIVYQMGNEWRRVEEVDADSTSSVDEPYIKASKEFKSLLENKGPDAAEEFKREYFSSWFDNEKESTLSANEKTRRIQFGQYYCDAFSKNIKQRLTPGFHCGKEQEIYNNFWSMLEIDDDGLEQEMYIWDTKTYSFVNDTETVQMDARNGNPKRNTGTTIFSNMYSGKRCKNVEVMLRPPQNMRDINTIIAWEATCRTKFKEYNTNPLHSLWNLPTIDKLIFLKHTASNHETTGWEWKKTPSGGFFKQII
mgnify:FL=1